ncbi:MAG: hypothetical protein IKW13_04810 [Thermoguttaceae bacterium]|nr:hypothetical protein [Thermoguttaceae bacterium]
MNDFEVLSRDAVEPVEPKREAETSPDAARRIRAELDGLLAELAEATEAVAYLEARENELVAEKAELARSLDEARRENKELADSNEAVERGLIQEAADAQRIAERFENALDAALNDVAIWRLAALCFGVSSVLAIGLMLAAFGS